MDGLSGRKRGMWRAVLGGVFAVAMCAVLLSGSPAWATGDTAVTAADVGINWTTTCTGMATSIGTYLAAAIGVALGIWAIVLGFKFLRRFVR